MKKYTSLVDVQADLASQKITCEELATYYLNNCKKYAHLNAMLEVFDDEAIALAKEIDLKVKNNSAGRLAGMIIAIKDNICYKGHVVSASSKILENYEAVYTATALQRLLDEDAIVIGRTNCDEFAMGASNENSAYGVVKNAVNEDRVPGGSSGGSAVAVQADLCLASLGSDTGGSVRQPASFTGTVGVKPTYGRISRYGLLAYASSFDQIGTFSSSASDAAILLEIMSGKDPMDATSSNTPVTAFEDQEAPKKYKIGVIKETLTSEGIDNDVLKRTEAIIESLKVAGHEVEMVSFPYLDYMVPCYYVLTTAEASSNYSRYSGVLYGHRSSNAVDIDSTIKKSRTEGFGEEVKRRIMTGTFVLSADFYEAYYSKAQKVRAIIKSETESLLKDVDFLISPTAPSTAFELGAKIQNPIQMYLADIYTVQASLAGLPAVSVPIGNDKQNLPIGLQIVGSPFQENSILRFAHVILNNHAN